MPGWRLNVLLKPLLIIGLAGLNGWVLILLEVVWKQLLAGTLQ
jgi:hypothetical protein